MGIRGMLFYDGREESRLGDNVTVDKKSKEKKKTTFIMSHRFGYFFLFLFLKTYVENGTKVALFLGVSLKIDAVRSTRFVSGRRCVGWD